VTGDVRRGILVLSSLLKVLTEGSCPRFSKGRAIGFGRKAVIIAVEIQVFRRGGAGSSRRVCRNEQNRYPSASDRRRYWTPQRRCQLEIAKIFFEYNSSANNLGVHGGS
jgi:hypothetical protein